MILDKIHYSFIYFSYKSYEVKYRSGRGYQYIKYTDAAHRTIGLPFAITIFIASAILSKGGVKDPNNVAFSLGSVLALYLYLELSLSKKKMWKYRYLYPNSKKYVVFYAIFLVTLIVIAALIRFLLN